MDETQNTSPPTRYPSPGRWRLFKAKVSILGPRWHLDYTPPTGSGHAPVCRSFTHHNMAVAWMLREQHEHAKQYAYSVGVNV